MTNKSIRDYINLIENAQKDVLAEGSEEQVYKVVALDKSNALKKPTKLNVKASSIEDVFSRLAANDWYALSINGVEVVAGKRLKQGVAEGLENNFVQPGVEVWYKGRFAGWTTGKVYDDPYNKSGKMVAFEPNPSEFPGDEGRILSLPYSEVSLRKSTSIGKLKGPEQGVAEEQLEETTPDAIAEISRLTRRP